MLKDMIKLEYFNSKSINLKIKTFKIDIKLLKDKYSSIIILLSLIILIIVLFFLADFVEKNPTSFFNNVELAYRIFYMILSVEINLVFLLIMLLGVMFEEDINKIKNIFFLMSSVFVMPF
jgi:hypothetical protein